MNVFMTRIIPDKLSHSFRVVRMEPDSAGELTELYSSNSYYFEYFSIEPTEERLREDMTILPDDCGSEQKFFLAYYDGDRPVAILDLIEGYPSADVCYIGLFMVSAELTGRGLGARVITELCEALKSMGFCWVRLAYGKYYERAARFWTKNGFVPMREAVHEVYGDLIVAQREL